MYFPILENLKCKKVYEHDYLLLDRWLGSRPKNTWKYLNPLQFAVDCEINSELATNIFLLCIMDEKIDLFEMRTIIRCPNCDSIVAKGYNTFSPKFQDEFCPECGTELDFNILKEEAEIYFSLKIAPAYSFRGEPIIENKVAETFDMNALKQNVANDDLTTLFGIFN